MKFTKQTLDDLALSEDEYSLIVDRLGREPNYLELGLFGSLWSEHCGYKHSKPLLGMFKTESPRLLVGAGEENAGVLDIGDGLAIVFKIESHNHPSAIEPYEGAATGVGGIIRDIFAMGARPIALLNSLRFGDLSDSRNLFLLNGVVAGISGYGNCIGIPNIGGETVFDKSYSGNPLVNAMCIGLLEKNELLKATAGPPGNLLLLVGSGTGRDGIHGASGLASRTFEDERELRPTVQVGNPFLEKILIEACLAVGKAGLIDGLQDLGAAGLTSAAVESASNGRVGIEINIENISRRDSGMEPYEVMLSETQERMLLSVNPKNLDKVIEIFDRWDIKCDVIGSTIEEENVKIFENGDLKAYLPIDILTNPPLYRLKGIQSQDITDAQKYNLEAIPVPDLTPLQVLKRLLSSSNISSKQKIFKQYDYQVQTNTVIPPGNDGALIRIKGTDKGLAASTDGNGRLCYLDPYIGALIAVSESCRNISCTGATPIALTNCLNFGNPEKLDVYYQLEECVKGIADASIAFESPVISGNVSLYNETHGTSIYPTPIIGAVGLTDHVSDNCTPDFKNIGDIVLILGIDEVSSSVDTLAGSEYLSVIHSIVAGQPKIELDLELNVQKVCRDLIAKKILESAHDCSDGGLAVTLSESAILGNLGFEGEFTLDDRWDSALFGETQSRIVVSVKKDNLHKLVEICKSSNLPYCELGSVVQDKFIINDLIDTDMENIYSAWMLELENNI
ncbi:MAG: phosphoribosylformylglycinamidine synthase subunit PurL [SAR202 cluster bacterium]|nr:phosphoribosylformylglycinamidine synthase II [Chloroflexota bacterium]MQG22766.1 phosphoribosylformylglycinamidine synthase subunit PurL [SAR202 cluster bacterium]|tara:strand:+ start:8070 stop:10274 length:2205 start_codon:yes stop_codon:yes gene_type:complete